MTSLFIKFEINMDYSPGSDGVFDLSDVHGPQFHRWLPDGKNDAIYLHSNDEGLIIKIWIEQCGYVNENEIIYDNYWRDLLEEDIHNWGRLNGGSLFGLVEIPDVSNELMETLEKKHSDYKNQYVLFEKRIIKHFYSPVRNFLNILRSYYGQYWLPLIPKWDSRLESSSSFLNSNGYAQWSIDGGNTWELLKSSPLSGNVQSVRAQNDFSEFITKDDWHDIRYMVQENHQPPIALSVLSNAIMLYDKRDIRTSIIFAVTALELAIDDSFQNIVSSINFKVELKSMSLFNKIIALLLADDFTKLEKNKEVLKILFQKFKNMNKEKKLNILQTLLSIPEKYVQSCNKIITLRNNNVVHEIKALPDDISEDFEYFIQIFQFLYPDNQLKFPFPNPGNQYFGGL